MEPTLFELKRVTAAAAAIVIGLALAGCQDTSEDPIVETNSLGITQIDIAHRNAGQDRILEIRGIDDKGTIASLTLRTGEVDYSPDIGIPDTKVFGTELTVTVNGTVGRFVNERLLPRAIPIAAPFINTFVNLAAVSAELEAEAGITLVRPTPNVAGPERAFSGWAPTSAFPTNKGYAYQACIGGDLATVHALGWNQVGESVGYRSHGTACTGSSGQGCSGASCYYGPCGYHVDGTVSFGQYAYIFDDGSGNCTSENAEQEPRTDGPIYEDGDIVAPYRAYWDIAGTCSASCP